jgi:tetratricopeptide (TPR) repeat protein
MATSRSVDCVIRRSAVLMLMASGLLLSLATSFAVSAQSQDDGERKRAFQLYREGRVDEALPVFERLAVADPWDRDVVETLGFLVLSKAVYTKDPDVRKAARRRGRELLIRAQQLGADDPLLKNSIDGIPPDGGDDVSFSSKKEVDDAMREGEAAFAKRDYAQAVQSYQLALLFDPQQYAAALFIGDAYYQLGQHEQAAEWYARAIKINPDRETAYRYWGDSLMKQGKMSEAREKFIEAYIAEPYNRLASGGFLNWGRQNSVALAHPVIEIPTSVTPLENGKMTINLDPKVFKKDQDRAAAAWMMYGLVRANWATSSFAKEYPEEKIYRHSLKEEAAALRAVVRALPKKEKDAKKLEASLQTLIKLEGDGLLEAYILLATPDQGIAQDFTSYRRANADKLRRYVVTYLINGGN